MTTSGAHAAPGQLIVSSCRPSSAAAGQRPMWRGGRRRHSTTARPRAA